MTSPVKWKLISLAQFVELQRGFDLPSQKRVPGQYEVISSGKSSGNHNEGPIKGPGFAIGRATNLGRPTWSENDYWPLNTVLYVKNFKGNDPKFAYYVFENLDLSGYDSGSVQPMLNRNYIANVQINIPELAEQQAIAATLSALDGKIESNLRAQKMGHELISALVKQALDGSCVPNGILANYCHLVRESAKVHEFTSAENYIGFEHMPRGSIFLDEWGSAEGLGSNKSRFQAGDVLFGKLRPYFKKVGIAPVNGVCSTDILVIRPNSPEDAAMIAAIASSDELITSLSAGATGTRMPRASWADLANWPVPILAESEKASLNAQIQPLANRLSALTIENRHLRALRETLLPELLSGRIHTRNVGLT